MASQPTSPCRRKTAKMDACSPSRTNVHRSPWKAVAFTAAACAGLAILPAMCADDYDLWVA